LKKLLFVNACSRAEEISRTWILCDVFLKKYRELYEAVDVIRCDLFAENIHCLGPDEVVQREKLIGTENFDHPMFGFAREFSEADEILIGAPYWDLSFPAVLKAYIENICVSGLTFRYLADGVEGLCAAKRLTYLTTAGGFFGETCHGSQYIEAIGKFLGIKNYVFLSAEGLDICEENTREIMKKAIVEVEQTVVNMCKMDRLH
jgi:FMN-dependent NADH-azoreductase